MEYDEEIRNLVKKRLAAMPPDISFSVGDYGDFTRDQLIDEVERNSDIGREMIEMQVNFIRKMPKLLKR